MKMRRALDELSTHHLARYALRAGEDMADKAADQGFAQGRGDVASGVRAGDKKMKRHRGLALALAKIERRNRGDQNQKTDHSVAARRTSVMKESVDLQEAKKHEALKAQIADHMDRRYREVEPDLPRHGNWHHASATDHLADHAYDHFNKHPDYDRKRINVHSIAKSVVDRYSTNDSRESKSNDQKRERRRVAAEKARATPPKPRKFREIWKKTGSHPGAGYHVKRVYHEGIEK